MRQLGAIGLGRQLARYLRLAQADTQGFLPSLQYGFQPEAQCLTQTSHLLPEITDQTATRELMTLNAQASVVDKGG